LSTKTKAKAEQLQWRRSKVVEMRSRGLSQLEIAHELQVSEASISSDMQYLRKQAKESIEEYVTEHLPEQYQVCLTALDALIKRAFDILDTSAADNREKLQAMELFKDTHLVKLELLSNATTIDSALGYIRDKQQQQKGLALNLTTAATATATAAVGNGNNKKNNYDDDDDDDQQLTASTATDKQTIF
jgi:BMFP domain-containing protein YqiC